MNNLLGVRRELGDEVPIDVELSGDGGMVVGEETREGGDTKEKRLRL